MNVHKNAKLTPRGRAEIVRRVVEEGQTPILGGQTLQHDPAVAGRFPELAAKLGMVV